MRVLSWPHLTLHFCKRSAKPCPLEKCSSIPPPTPKTSPPLGPGCPLPKPSFCQGGKGRREGADPWRCPQQPHGVSEALGGQEHPYGGPGRAARLPAVPMAAALAAQHGSHGGCSPRGPGARQPWEGCSRSRAWLRTLSGAPTICQGEPQQIALSTMGAFVLCLNGAGFRASNREADKVLLKRRELWKRP